MKEKMDFGLTSQVYAAPRAESVEVMDQGVLCASGTPHTPYAAFNIEVGTEGL